MIQIIRGKYGHYVDGKVVGKTKDSAPFELSPEREAELVAQGVAVYVHLSTDPIGFDEVPPEKPEEWDDAPAFPEYDENSSAKDLRDIAKQCGLSFKVGMKKSEMIEALDAFFDANLTDEEPDGEPAPTFDASEAVL